MTRHLKAVLFWSLFLSVAPALVLARASTCPDVVNTALKAADVLCAQTGRNQACYGNIHIDATAQPDAQNFRFQTVGDLVNIGDIQSLNLSPMTPETGDWGVAILKLQANLPDTLPGQNVTFLLFGDVQIVNAVTPDNPKGLRPMQAFYLRTGVSDSQCSAAPESGVLVQTPKGSGEVAFNVNSVDVQMGSTIFLQSEAKKEMTVSTLEGAAFITARNKTEVIVPGTWARVPLEPPSGGPTLVPVVPLPVFPAEIMQLVQGLIPSAAPEDPRSYEKRFTKFDALPISLLEREIEIAPPLAAEEVQQINSLIDQGIVCGQDPLPPCEGFTLPTENEATIAAPTESQSDATTVSPTDQTPEAVPTDSVSSIDSTPTDDTAPTE